MLLYVLIHCLCCQWPTDVQHVMCRCMNQTGAHNDHIKSEQKVKQKKEVKRRTRKEPNEKRDVKKSKNKLPEKRSERTIAIATAVYLLSSNNNLILDASSWF